MDWDWGGFCGNIVGVMGAYWIFTLQRRTDLKKQQPLIRKSRYRIKNHIQTAITSLMILVMDHKDKTLDEVTDYVADKVITELGHAEEANVEIQDQEIGKLIRDILADIAKNSVEIFRDPYDDDEMKKLRLIAILSDIVLKYNEKILQLKTDIED